MTAIASRRVSIDPAQAVRAVNEAVALIRAYLAEDEAEVVRIPDEAEDPAALASAVARMFTRLALYVKRPDLIERFLDDQQRALQDAVLDMHLDQDAP